MQKSIWLQSFIHFCNFLRGCVLKYRVEPVNVQVWQLTSKPCTSNNTVFALHELPKLTIFISMAASTLQSPMMYVWETKPSSLHLVFRCKLLLMFQFLSLFLSFFYRGEKFLEAGNIRAWFIPNLATNSAVNFLWSDKPPVTVILISVTCLVLYFFVNFMCLIWLLCLQKM